MSERKKERLLSQARTFYAEGLCKREVAEAIGVSESTIHDWIRKDRGQGIDWDELRKERKRTSPEVVLGILERRFANLVAGGEAPAKEGEEKKEPPSEDRLLKLLRVIELYRGMKADVAVDLGALERFVRFCVRNLPPQQIAPVAEAVDAYMEHLKRKRAEQD